MLSTYLLRLSGLDVWTASREASSDDRSALVAASGARFVSTRETPLLALGEDVGGFDLVVEATGDAQIMADCMGLLRRNGVACLLGIDSRQQTVEVDGRVLGVDSILENHVLFGSVNAQRQDWIAAVEALDRAHRQWPDALEAFVGLRAPLDRFPEAFDYRGVKATLLPPGD